MSQSENGKCRPAMPSDRKLQEETGTSKQIRSFSLSDFAVAPITAAPTIIARTKFQRGYQGVLLDFAISWPGDWGTSLVYLATIESATGSINRNWLGQYKRAVGSMQQPISLRPHGLFADVNEDFAIVIANNDGVALEGQGYLSGFTWSERQARMAREFLERMAFGPQRPWPPGSVFGGS